MPAEQAMSQTYDKFEITRPDGSVDNQLRDEDFSYHTDFKCGCRLSVAKTAWKQFKFHSPDCNVYSAFKHGFLNDDGEL